METILEIQGLGKKYHGKPVLNDVNMRINKGDIYGFVGKNGAGKTTLIRIISGLTAKSDGSFSLFGIPDTDKRIIQARKKICSMVEAPAIYPELTATDNMKMQCMITRHDYSCISELLAFVGLDQTGKKKAKDFSLGMRQRLGIAMALVNDPELMLLDEPINGLDPEGIRQIRELLLKMHEEKQVTILISSHILSELSLFATRYCFIDHGVIIKESTIDDITGETGETCLLRTNDNSKAVFVLKSLGYDCNLKDDGVFVKSDVDLMRVCALFEKEGIRLLKHIASQVDLEGYFMNLIEGEGQ